MFGLQSIAYCSHFEVQPNIFWVLSKPVGLQLGIDSIFVINSHKNLINDKLKYQKEVKNNMRLS